MRSPLKLLIVNRSEPDARQLETGLLETGQSVMLLRTATPAGLAMQLLRAQWDALLYVQPVAGLDLETVRYMIAQTHMNLPILVLVDAAHPGAREAGHAPRIVLPVEYPNDARAPQYKSVWKLEERRLHALALDIAFLLQGDAPARRAGHFHDHTIARRGSMTPTMMMAGIPLLQTARTAPSQAANDDADCDRPAREMAVPVPDGDGG
jgi:hypothetical protein